MWVAGAWRQRVPPGSQKRYRMIHLLRRHRPPARRASADIGVVLLIGIAPIPESARHAGRDVEIEIGVSGCRIPIPVGADDPPPTWASAMGAVPPVVAAPTPRVERLTACVLTAPGAGTVARVSGTRRRRLSGAAWTWRISAGLSHGTRADASRISAGLSHGTRADASRISAGLSHGTWAHTLTNSAG